MVFPPLPFASGAQMRGADNTTLDGLFYDIGALSREERARVRNCGKAEGMILEVGPSCEPSLRVWNSLEQCEGLGEGLAPRYRAITVAGVGSSALGSAALARNVADALRGPVLAVVSGQGLADIASEAMGGFFLFGGVNAMRHGANSFDAAVDALWSINPFWPKPGFTSPDPGEGFQLARFSKDVKTLTRLLGGAVECDWLVGHSKGNLVISEALYALRSRDAARFDTVARGVPIVTFGARIAMPAGIAAVIDVMGDLDSFGAMNSRPDIPVDVNVPGAWHHTNTRLPFHVPVRKVLQEIAEGIAEGIVEGSRDNAAPSP